VAAGNAFKIAERGKSLRWTGTKIPPG